jgi:hypothetical protein
VEEDRARVLLVERQLQGKDKMAALVMEINKVAAAAKQSRGEMPLPMLVMA